MDLLSELNEVEHRRRLEAMAGLVSAVAVGQLFFAAFAFGHSRGPTSMGTGELLSGMVGALFLSVLIAALLRRRRLERRADVVLRAREGRHARRVAVFERHVTIDDEVVLRAAVDRVEREPGRIRLRYIDPRHSGPVLRELEGDRADLDRLGEALGAA